MPRRVRSDDGKNEFDLFPMDDATWNKIAEELSLSPQQERIAKLVLCDMQDRDIASKLTLTVPTVRTYMSRIFERTGVTTRLTLVLKIFRMAMERCRC